MSSSLVNNKAQTKASNRKFPVRLKEKKKTFAIDKNSTNIFHTTVNFHYVRSITIFQIYRVPIAFFYAAAQKYKDYQVLDALLFVVSFQTTLKFAIFSQRETSGKN